MPPEAVLSADREPNKARKHKQPPNSRDKEELLCRDLKKTQGKDLQTQRLGPQNPKVGKFPEVRLLTLLVGGGLSGCPKPRSPWSLASARETLLSSRAAKGLQSSRALQDPPKMMISRIRFTSWAIEPERRSLRCMWASGPLMKAHDPRGV